MHPTRTLTIVAQDPQLRYGAKRDGPIVTAKVTIPNEALDEGPRGARVFVIDYDASTKTLYQPLRKSAYGTPAAPVDPYAAPGKLTEQVILDDPRFHSQNVYAIVMRTLARFEFALGRRISWGFGGHQLFVAPHAFGVANAFYTRVDRALLFGYFPVETGSGERTVYSCLSHDVIVHEATHSLLDGLRERYQDPSSPDQAAFHEGFSDIVALLSTFSLPEVMRAAFPGGAVDRKLLTREALQKGVLLSLAEEMGSALGGFRGSALRQSATIKPDPKILDRPRFQEEHERGEIFVAAMLHALLDVLEAGFESLGDRGIDGKPGKGPLDRERVILEAAETAGKLLTIAIRALDYAPAVHLTFGDYLSALLTADKELVPDDNRYHFREAIRNNFAAFGILPASGQKGDGAWEPPMKGVDDDLDYSTIHLRELQTDVEEVFRFVWANREKLGVDEHAYTKVLSVRPVRRHGPDGIILHETVAEYMQTRNLTAAELRRFGVRKPAGMSSAAEVTLYGGGTLIFDEFGRLKFHVRNRIDSKARQSKRLEHLYKSGYFDEARSARRRIAAMHLTRLTPWPLGASPGEER